MQEERQMVRKKYRNCFEVWWHSFKSSRVATCLFFFVSVTVFIDSRKTWVICGIRMKSGEVESLRKRGRKEKEEKANPFFFPFLFLF